MVAAPHHIVRSRSSTVTLATLLLRLTLVALALLWTAQTYQRALLTLMLPLISHTLALTLNDFTIQSLTLDAPSGIDMLRLRADLAAPLWVNNLKLQPLDGQGWYEVAITAGGVLQYAVCMLIVTFTWPMATWCHAGQRLLLAAPLAIGLTVLNATITLTAELWHGVTNPWLPDPAWPLMTVSRIMMGGGGLMLAILLGAITAYFTKPRLSHMTYHPESSHPLRSSAHHE